MSESPISSRLMVLLFTDLVESVDLKTRFGAAAYAKIISRHDALFEKVIGSIRGSEILKDTGDGFLARFETVSDGVSACLSFQQAVASEGWEPEPVRVRMGLHLGQVTELEQSGGDRPKLVGLAADVCARLMGLALPGQILMTRAVFDDGRQYIKEHRSEHAQGEALQVRWMAHGPYHFKGTDEPMDVFEVGIDGVAPLATPTDSEKARRAVPAGEEEMYGWRPAIGLTIPGRDNWRLVRKLGEGGFGEVWLAGQIKTRVRHVFKFCFNADKVRSLKRELTLFRLLSEALGDRPDIARIYDVQLREPPYYLESEHTEHGSLVEWASARGGIKNLTLATRLDLVMRTCDAVAASHSLGVLHKDLKPSNILIYETIEGEPRPRLADFGIGAVIDKSHLEGHAVTVSGMTDTLVEGPDATPTGTRLYAPPESLVGMPFTIQGDVYALGVILYQMVVGDLNRPLAQGWEPEIEDPLLVEDIASTVGRREDRLASASELAERLRNLEARREARHREAHDRAMVRRRRRILRMTAVAAVAMTVLAAVVGLMLVRESRLRTDAEQARDEAATAQRAEARQREAAEFQSYVVNIASAARALQENAVRTAKLRLRQIPERLHHWEWSYLANLADQSLLTLEGHEAEIQAVACSPDGQRIASGAEDGSILVWEAGTGRRLQSIAAHDAPIYCLAFSPDGAWLASGSGDRSVKLWEVSTGRHRSTLDGHQGVVTDLAFTSDAASLYSSSSDTTIRLWDLSTAQQITTLADGEASIDCIALNPQGTRLAAGADDQTIALWDIATAVRITEIAGHEGYVTCLAFSPDGLRLVSGSSDTALRIWDATTGEALLSLHGHEDYVTSLATSPDGRRIVSGAEDSTVRLWDAATGALLATMTGHDGHVHAVAFSADGTRIASGSEDRTIKFWDVLTRERFTAARQGTVASRAAGVRSIAFGPDGRRLAMALDDSSVALLDLDTGEELARLRGHDGGVRCVAVSADGARIASGSDDRTIRIWNGVTGEPITTLWAHERFVSAVAFSPDGSGLVSGSWDGTVKLWDVARWRAVGTLYAAEASITSLAFSPDGTRLVVGATDGTVALCAARAGQPATLLGGHEGPVFAVAFSPDSDRVVSGSTDRTVRLWDAVTGAEVAVLRGHNGAVKAVAFSPDGSRIVSGSSDMTTKVWDTATGQELATLPGQDATVDCIAFSPDGVRLASGSLEGTLRVRDALGRLARFERRVEAAGAAASARPIVRRLLDRELEPAHVVMLLEADGSLSPAVLEAALDLVLLHYGRQLADPTTGAN